MEPFPLLFFATVTGGAFLWARSKRFGKRATYGACYAVLDLSVRSSSTRSWWTASQRKECHVEAFEAGVLLAFTRFPHWMDLSLEEVFVPYGSIAWSIEDDTLELSWGDDGDRERIAFYWPARRASSMAGRAFLAEMHTRIGEPPAGTAPYR